ncbi:MAG: hypothetical protein LBQ24_02620 [Candidatus Peribacteria bacterium]|jgi:hypothetical protein|nr:hypothetical protein [Candidatus Peribacteria bacterium]
MYATSFSFQLAIFIVKVNIFFKFNVGFQNPSFNLSINEFQKIKRLENITTISKFFKKFWIIGLS